jgi:hypothetical protein
MAAKIHHDLIERLVKKYRKDATVFKHYRKKHKAGKKAVVLEAIADGRAALPLRLRNPKMYEAKLKAQRDRAMPPYPQMQYHSDCNHNKYDPPWAKAAQDVLNNPKTALKDVKDKLSGYEKEDSNLTTKFEDLKLKLIKAETEQIKVRGRIECMKIFLADEKTLTITEWILED